MTQSVDRVLGAIQAARWELEAIERPEPADHPRWGVYNRVRAALHQLALARACVEKENGKTKDDS
jgi:hypothetical protein